MKSKVNISSQLALRSGSFFNIIFTKYFNRGSVFSGRGGYLLSTTNWKNSEVDIFGNKESIWIENLNPSSGSFSWIYNLNLQREIVCLYTCEIHPLLNFNASEVFHAKNIKLKFESLYLLPSFCFTATFFKNWRIVNLQSCVPF